MGHILYIPRQRPSAIFGNIITQDQILPIMKDKVHFYQISQDAGNIKSYLPLNTPHYIHKFMFFMCLWCSHLYFSWVRHFLLHHRIAETQIFLTLSTSLQDLKSRGYSTSWM